MHAKIYVAFFVTFMAFKVVLGQTNLLIEGLTQIKSGNATRGYEAIETFYKVQKNKNEKLAAAKFLAFAPPESLKKTTQFYATYFIENSKDDTTPIAKKMWRIIADSSFATGKLEMAKKAYEKMIEIDDNSDSTDYAKYKLGWVYVNLENYEKMFSLWQSTYDPKSTLAETMVRDLGKFSIEYLYKTNKWPNIDIDYSENRMAMYEGIENGYRRSYRGKSLLPLKLIKKNKVPFYVLNGIAKSNILYQRKSCGMLNWIPDEKSENLELRIFMPYFLKCIKKKPKNANKVLAILENKDLEEDNEIIYTNLLVKYGKKEKSCELLSKNKEMMIKKDFSNYVNSLSLSCNDDNKVWQEIAAYAFSNNSILADFKKSKKMQNTIYLISKNTKLFESFWQAENRNSWLMNENFSKNFLKAYNSDNVAFQKIWQVIPTETKSRNLLRSHLFWQIEHKNISYVSNYFAKDKTLSTLDNMALALYATAKAKDNALFNNYIDQNQDILINSCSKDEFSNEVFINYLAGKKISSLLKNWGCYRENIAKSKDLSSRLILSWLASKDTLIKASKNDRLLSYMHKVGNLIGPKKKIVSTFKAPKIIKNSKIAKEINRYRIVNNSLVTIKKLTKKNFMSRLPQAFRSIERSHKILTKNSWLSPTLLSNGQELLNDRIQKLTIQLKGPLKGQLDAEATKALMETLENLRITS